jgi:tRNA (adenine22-N1)-methyltransferase
MNRRLDAIEALVRPGRGLIDVGTDHGYLPVSLARHGYPGALFASDLREGPLAAARRSAAAAGLAGRIAFQLCDGLDACAPESVDTIVIAGMGGDTICGILDRAEWCLDGRYSLILQPMTRAEVLRFWLVNNGFTIDTERLTQEEGRIYAVLRARFGGAQRLCDAELFTGAFTLVEGNPLWPRFRALQLRRFEKIARALRASGREPGRLKITEEILRTLKERDGYDDDPGHF